MRIRLSRPQSLLAIMTAVFQPWAAAHGADCPQEQGRYADSQGIYTLAFEPVDPESSASSHSFKMTIKDSDIVLDGYVMASEPVNRSNGFLFNNCPEGDITGADIAACTVWQGVIYASDQGKIDLLPQQGAVAASQILLAGLGPALQASSAWGRNKATVAPWDVLTLKGCGS
jgi:hypothetical protein